MALVPQTLETLEDIEGGHLNFDRPDMVFTAFAT